MLKNEPLSKLIELEQQEILDSQKKYGEFFDHAFKSHALLQKFVTNAKPDAFFFLIFLSQVRKHHLLAILSAARRHHVQMVMNLRQVLEAGATAAYAIGNSKTEDYANLTEIGLLETPSKLVAKRYKWLEDNYPNGSTAIKNIKDQIQKSAHANIVDAYRNFKIKDGTKHLEISTPFFDYENEFQTKSDFWIIGNVAMGLVDLFYGVNQKYNVLTFTEDFVANLQAFESENKRLKELQMQTEKFKRADKRARIRDAALSKSAQTKP